MIDLRASYDAAADVLYVTLGRPVPIEGDGLPRGVELDYEIENGAPKGLTVIGYHRNSWPESVDELAEIASRHLSIAVKTAAGSIRDAVEREQARH